MPRTDKARGKAYAAKWRATRGKSPEIRAAQAQWKAKYRASAKGQATEAAYSARPEVQERARTSAREIRRRADVRAADKAARASPEYKAWYKAYCEKNRAKIRAKTAAWSKTPLGRAYHASFTAIRNAKLRGLPSDWSVRSWEACKAAWNNSCAYCGVASDCLHQDHVIPVASPVCPGTIRSNMVPACEACNLSKQDKPLVSWLSDGARFEAVMRYLESVVAKGA